MHRDIVVDRVTMETDREVLSEVLECFEDFLRGVGFSFDGHLDMVEDDSTEEDK
jgi:hypothetical protein